MLKIAVRRNQAEPADPPDLTPWHDLFHWIKHHGEHRVYIPYAEYIAVTASAAVVRMRRDFSVLLGMIEAHAVLHQANRKRDSYGRIVATAADYAACRDILAEAFAVSSGRKVKDSVRRAVDAVSELNGRSSDVTVAQVARHLKRDRTVVTRGLREAADLAYLANQEDKAGRAVRYVSAPTACPTTNQRFPANYPRTFAHPHRLHTQTRRSAMGVQVCRCARGVAAKKLRSRTSYRSPNPSPAETCSATRTASESRLRTRAPPLARLLPSMQAQRPPCRLQALRRPDPRNVRPAAHRRHRQVRRRPRIGRGCTNQPKENTMTTTTEPALSASAEAMLTATMLILAIQADDTQTLISQGIGVHDGTTQHPDRNPLATALLTFISTFMPNAAVSKAVESVTGRSKNTTRRTTRSSPKPERPPGQSQPGRAAATQRERYTMSDRKHAGTIAMPDTGKMMTVAYQTDDSGGEVILTVGRIGHDEPDAEIELGASQVSGL